MNASCLSFLRPLSASAGAALLFLTFPLLQAQETPPETDAAAAAAPGDGFTPKEYTIDRYAKIRGKSPFEFELAKPPAEVTVDPFAELVLAGYAGSLGSPTVYLVNTKTQERITVLSERSGRPNKSGFKVISIDRGPTLRSTTATLEKDGQQGVLKFDSKALDTMVGGAGSGGAAGGARPVIPGQPNQPGAVPRPMIPGQPARPQQAYQAPQAFIPGANRGGQAQAQAQNGVFIPNQNAMVPGKPGNQLTNQPGGDTQLQINNLVNNQAPQNLVPNSSLNAPNIAVPSPVTGTPQQQPRRRVVLPTP